MMQNTHNEHLVVAFRADASLQIGSGHVMRCLTLADALAAKGGQCHFLCRVHPGDLMDTIVARGHSLHKLPDAPASCVDLDSPTPPHACWLGCDWAIDARQSRDVIQALDPDWLVVDHYALDARWERAVISLECRLLVIDDLADRTHEADLLLDQNLGRRSENYLSWVPASCRCLIGPRYALLHPEFARLREVSLARRRSRPALGHLLISLGGVDKDNATGQVLDALKTCDLPDDCRISVIMGKTAPWLASVQAQVASMPWPTEVAVNVADMAERMAGADLAIGAAGSTAWERCCLGLPSLMVVLAENQQGIADHLHNLGAAVNLGAIRNGGWRQHLDRACQQLASHSLSKVRMSEKASDITHGDGVRRVLPHMYSMATA